ncbi:MAG: hypothetical protein AAF847_18245, partial [Bacteroidota bacterium]
MPLKLVLATVCTYLLLCPIYAQSIFPKDFSSWPVASPESQGFSSKRLKAARTEMTTDQGKPFQELNLIIIRNGYNIWHYGDPYSLPQGLKAQKDWASCGRSLMTTFFGMALQEENMGVASLDRPVHQLFNSPSAWNMDERISLRHLLGYTACAEPPGASWEYACHYFTMYKIIRDIDGEAPRNRLDRLAQLIGANWKAYEYWGHDQDVPFLTIKATAEQAARWGYLWLNEGNWKGNQIIDPDFVAASLQPIPTPDGKGMAHPNEGLQIHLNADGMWGDVIPRDAYAAFGAGGRIIFVCPSLNLVIASASSPDAYQKTERAGYVVRDIRNMYEPIIKAMVEQTSSLPYHEEKNGFLAVEAEDYHSQTHSETRRWYRVDAESEPFDGLDHDEDHSATASGNAYLEILPDTRTTHADVLIPGQNFSGTPGKLGILNYQVKVNTPGRYYIWVRAFSTGTEDNGIHVGLNGEWVDSGQ